jgi:hypothetical protein
MVRKTWHRMLGELVMAGGGLLLLIYSIYSLIWWAIWDLGGGWAEGIQVIITFFMIIIGIVVGFVIALVGAIYILRSI